MDGQAEESKCIRWRLEITFAIQVTSRGGSAQGYRPERMLVGILLPTQSPLSVGANECMAAPLVRREMAELARPETQPQTDRQVDE